MLENFKPTYLSMKKDVEALVKDFYLERIDANQHIIDLNLLVTQKLFKH